MGVRVSPSCSAISGAVQTVRHSAGCLPSSFSPICSGNFDGSRLAIFRRGMSRGAIRISSETVPYGSKMGSRSRDTCDWRRVPADSAVFVVGRDPTFSGELKLANPSFQVAGNFVWIVVGRISHRRSNRDAHVSRSSDSPVLFFQVEEPGQVYRHHRNI